MIYQEKLSKEDKKKLFMRLIEEEDNRNIPRFSEEERNIMRDMRLLRHYKWMENKK